VRYLLLLAHRWTGLAMAGFLVVAGLTGSVLAFGDRLDAALNPDLFTAGPGPALPVLAAAERAHAVSLALLPDAPGAPLRLRLAGPVREELFLDPATGRELGRRPLAGCCLQRRSAVAFLLRLHETLTLGTPGRLLMGAVALLWTVDCVGGLMLTLPRARPLLAHWRQAWRVKRGASTFRLIFDLHRAGALWCWAALLVLAFSGAALSLHAELFRPAVTTLLPTTPTPTPASVATAPIGLADALGRAAAAWPGAAPRLLWAYRAGGTVVVASRADLREAEFFLGPDETVLDAGTGAVLARRRASDGRAGDLLLQAQFPLHSGRAGGLAGRLLVCAMGVATAGLSLTGFWIWWRKRAARRLAATRLRLTSMEHQP
jgi:uncharacterized iron-regulated membrane protein